MTPEGPGRSGAIRPSPELTPESTQRREFLRGPESAPLTRSVQVVILVLVVAIGAWLRMQEISRSFYGDEAYHVIAARSVIRGEGPLLSPGYAYVRGSLHTQAVALAFRLFGESEVAARLPSLLSSLASILLLFLLGRRWFGPQVGLVAAGIQSLEPMSVHFGAWVRFYAPAQMLILIAVLAFDSAMTRARRLPFLAPSSPLVPAMTTSHAGGCRLGPLAACTGAWLAVFGISLGIALTLQVLAADVLVGIYVYALIAVAWGWRLRGGMVLRTPEALIVGAGALGLAALFLIMPALVTWVRELASHVPVWNQRESGGHVFYVRMLRGTYPVEWFLVTVGTIAALARRPVGGLLAASLFWGSLLSHSLVFPQKSHHYIFLIFPFFLLLVASGLVFVVRLVLARLPSARLVVRGGVAVLVVAGFLSAAPWLPQSLRKGTTIARYTDWRAAVREIEEEIAPEDFVIAGVADEIFAIRYYLGRGEAHLASESWVTERKRSRQKPSAQGHGPYDVPAWESVAPVLDLLNDYPRVWVLFATRRFDTPSAVSPRNALRGLAAIGETREVAEGATVIRLDRGSAGAFAD